MIAGAAFASVAPRDVHAVTTFTVTTTADGGPGSLRKAITDANTTPNVGGPDVINFSIGGGVGPATIKPFSPLPTISESVVIDGTTQTGCLPAGTPCVTLDGGSAGASDGLSIGFAAGGGSVTGLRIVAFSGNGVVLTSTGTTSFFRNYIGVDPSGTIATPNGLNGMHVVAMAIAVIGDGTVANGNIIAGAPGGSGVRVELAGSKATIRGNGHFATSPLILDNVAGGNIELPPPVITSTGLTTSGTACAGCIVDVYTVSGLNRTTYAGATIADGAGAWTFAHPVAGPLVSAAATDAAGNTSEAAAPFSNSCGAICITGLHEGFYTNSFSSDNHCTAFVQQDANTPIAGLTGTMECTTARGGTFTGTLNTSTGELDIDITFTGGFTNHVDGFMNANGDLGSGTWYCVLPSPCGGPHPWNSQRVPAASAATISAATGGTVTTSLGDTITFDPGAVMADTNVSIGIEPLPFPPEPGVRVLSRAYRALPPGTFSAPVTAVLRYTAEDLAGGVSPADLEVMVYDPSVGWRVVNPSSVNLVDMTITVSIPHFSVFGIFDCKTGQIESELATDGIGNGCDVDDDGDGCLDAEETLVDHNFGGQRNPQYYWDFFDVTGDRNVDLGDAQDVLSYFGDPALPDTPGDLRDRDVYYPEIYPWLAVESNTGVDLTDAINALLSFGDDCSYEPN